MSTTATAAKTPQPPLEVLSAVMWWRKQIEGTGRLTTDSSARFGSSLQALLMEKVVGHWFPKYSWCFSGINVSEPRRGQGHRSITLDRLASLQDPVLLKAASSVGLENIFDCFPKHLEQVSTKYSGTNFLPSR